MSIWNELQGVDFKQSFYNANGIRTRAIEAGSGYPLIFMHGTSGHAEAYMKNIKAHAEHFHVYAIDFVGHGYSDAPDIDYSMQHYVDHLLGFLDAIGAEKTHLSGESMGASVAAWFALQHPERVGKLVMNTGVPLGPPAASPGAKSLQDLVERTKKATAGGTPTFEAIRQRMLWLFKEEESLTNELIDCRKAIYSQPGRAEMIKRITVESIGCLLDPAARKTFYNPENLKKIPHETLFIWTTHNPGQPAALAHKAAEMMPNAKVVVLENSAHWPQWEETDLFNQLHIDFLNS